jgi:predicted RNase H-like HicB family nuclease
MKPKYTAVVRRDGKWWIGWIEEVPGVNAQAKSRVGLMDDLQSALKEALEMNRSEAIAAAGSDFEEVSVSL